MRPPLGSVSSDHSCRGVCAGWWPCPVGRAVSLAERKLWLSEPRRQVPSSP